ncbi:MAG: hypothetical protein K8F25_19005, partial [Fimbriimonadaceae bacterium]|nr:hypothetical protein [Alphaproteobacteria bacterium]
MNPYAEFTSRVHAVVRALGEAGKIPGSLPLDRVVAEPPRDPSHGDLTTNAAMVLAKNAGMKPRDIASLIAGELQRDSDIASVEIAGPGFINVRLDTSWWASALKAILIAGAAYGRSDIGNREPVNVEYVSANPTGPLHVGHCRGAVFGDAL